KATTSTTRASETVCAQPPGSPASRSHGVSASAPAAPPTAEARVPTSVIATWIVASSASGSRLRRSAVSAPRTPCARSWPSRDGRADTSAISEPAKKALARIDTPISTISTQMLSMGDPSGSDGEPQPTDELARGGDHVHVVAARQWRPGVRVRRVGPEALAPSPAHRGGQLDVRHLLAVAPPHVADGLPDARRRVDRRVGGEHV